MLIDSAVLLDGMLWLGLPLLVLAKLAIVPMAEGAVLSTFNNSIPLVSLDCLRILICVNGGLKHVNTPDSYLRERCAKRTASVLSVA